MAIFRREINIKTGVETKIELTGKEIEALLPTPQQIEEEKARQETLAVESLIATKIREQATIALIAEGKLTAEGTLPTGALLKN